MEPHEYRRYLKDSAQPVDDSDKDKPESYAYGEVREMRPKFLDFIITKYPSSLVDFC